MRLADLLNTVNASPVNIWNALKKRFGDGIVIWEPDTFAIELQRLGVEPTAQLMTKVLAAQTAVTTTTFAHDHEVLFAFALACDGVPHTSDQQAHPHVEQLAYAVDQLRKLRPDFDPDEHTDPDEVDAAVAILLKADGFYVAPPQLAFAEEILERLVHTDAKLAKKVKDLWPAVADGVAHDEKIKILNTYPDTRPEMVQLKRLAMVARYLHERAQVDQAMAREAGL